MADNRKESKENQTRWIFKDAMHTVEDMIDPLGASKIEYEGRGLDFEGDLVKLYSELRKTLCQRNTRKQMLVFFFLPFSCILISSGAFNTKLKGIMKQTTKEKCKLPGKCMFLVNIHSFLKSRTGLL